MKQGRLILPEPGSATWNMSLDQAIMESVNHAAVEHGESAPTLRFYTWSSPSLSLGYFQSHRLADQRYASQPNVERVRRSTGGGAILHHHELTYSITIPVMDGVTGARTDLYTGVHTSIVSVLSEYSIAAKPYREDPRIPGIEDAFLCFQRRTDEDLIVSGYKILGSAQRRAKRAVLQHGSLLIRSSEFANELPGIAELTSKVLSPTELAARISRRIEHTFGYQLVESLPDENEQKRAEQIQADRFCEPKWMLRR